jgi:hypothetical protein
MSYFFYERSFDMRWIPVKTTDHPDHTVTPETRKSRPERSTVHEVPDGLTLDQCAARHAPPAGG